MALVEHPGFVETLLTRPRDSVDIFMKLSTTPAALPLLLNPRHDLVKRLDALQVDDGRENNRRTMALANLVVKKRTGSKLARGSSKEDRESSAVSARTATRMSVPSTVQDSSGRAQRVSHGRAAPPPAQQRRRTRWWQLLLVNRSSNSKLASSRPASPTAPVDL